MSPLLSLLGQFVVGWGKAVLVEKQSLARARHKRMMKAAETESDWQALMVDASRQSWKDEAWTLCFIIILAMCFIPAMQPYIAHGFAILETTPAWFQWAVLASIGASFGLRGFDKWRHVKGKTGEEG